MNGSAWRWDRRAPHEFEGWLVESRGQAPPPMFVLEDRRQTYDILGEFDFDGVAERNTDSGALRIRLLTDPIGRSDIDVGRLVRAEDPRGLLDPVETNAISTLRWSIRTTIATDTGILPTVGPGGRIDLYATRHRTDVLLSVRHRLFPLSSSWRPPGEIVSSITEAVGQRPARITAQVGYFELSFHDYQDLLRPALVAMLEDDNDQDEAPRWRTIIVLPLTRSDVDDRAGFGAWDVR